MKQPKKLLNILLTLLLAACVIGGAGFMLYPTVSDIANRYLNRKTVEDYKEQAENFPTEDYSALLEAAQEYNKAHTVNNIVDAFAEVADREDGESAGYAPGSETYYNLIDPFGNGVMGYIEIPKIEVKLALYHGTSPEVLETGCGHIEGTSLPVGGENTHTVISAHRGMPGARLFSDLDQMEIGDVFTIHVLDETLIYEVDQVLTVLPDETSALGIEEGSDLCTLVTCTPYGLNTHRLLVRGRRVTDEAVREAQEETDEKAQSGFFAKCRRLFEELVSPKDRQIVLGTLAGIAVLILILLLYRIRKKKK